MKLREVDLFINRGNYCGGTNLYIEIIIDKEKKCDTEREKSFNPYRPIKWKKERLGNCTDIEFDANLEQIKFDIKTDDNDKFCPGKITFTMNNEKFIKDTMTEWSVTHSGLVATKVVE